MNVAQSPIIIAIIDELAPGAGGIGIVARGPLERGVQNADVEETGPRPRIGGGEIVAGRRRLEALPMQGDTAILVREGTRLSAAEGLDVRGQRHALGEAALGVVVAIE